MTKINKARKYSSPLVKELLSEITAEERHRTKTKMILAARLEDLINSKKWSQNEFASRLSKQPSEISKWLSGTHNFTVDTLTDIASVLNIPVSELLTPGQIEVINSVQVKVVVKQVPQIIPYATPLAAAREFQTV